MSILRFERVRREIGTFVILDEIDAAIALGDRIGLVGPNGAGKTTLLRIAAGPRRAGRRHRPPQARADDRPAGPGIPLRRRVHGAPDLRAAVRHGAAHLEAMDARAGDARARPVASTEPAYADLQHRFEILGGYTLDLRVDEALSGLGFARDEWAKPPTALSGGEQTRATLARLVIADPDLLLLDEPTNHLDIGALEWLEEHLRRRARRRCSSRPTTARSSTPRSAAVWELRDRQLRRSGATTAPTTASARSATRGRPRTPTRRPTRSRASGSSSSATGATASSARCTSTRRGSSGSRPTGSRRRSRRPRLRAAGRRARRRRARRDPGEIVVRLEGLAVGYLPGRGALDADGPPGDASRRVGSPRRRSSRPSAATGSGSSGRTGRARRRSCGRSPATCRRSTGSLTFGNAVQPGYLAQLRGAAIPGATVLDALLAAIPVTPGEARAYLARFLFRGDDVVQGGPVAVRRRAVAPRARPARDPAVEPAPARRADEPPRHRRPRGDRGVPASSRRRRCSSSSHDRRLLETVCRPAVGRRRRAGGAVRRRLAAPGGRRSPTAGRSHGAAERERRGACGRRSAAAGGRATAPSCRDEVRRRSSRGGRRDRVDPQGLRRRRQAARRPDAARSCRRTPTGARRPRSMPS